MEKLLFLYKFLRSPKSVGSITPSSRFLTRAMMQMIDWSNVRTIAELGAGTGVFTRYIAEHKHPDCHVYVFEKDLNMRRRLEHLYPSFHFYESAASITSVSEAHSSQGLDCIVSGLPFANFPQDLRDDIMRSIEQSLAPGGLFIAFQYSTQMRRHLDKNLERRSIRFVPLNFPPAFVYCYRKPLPDQEHRLLSS